jgi:hypothetical protein
VRLAAGLGGLGSSWPTASAEVHSGHAVVVAEVAEIAPGDARVRLKELATVA